MVKGFRPGREPPELRKRMAKERFGELSGLQERLVDIFAERGRQESRTLIRRWIAGSLVAAIALGAVAGLLTLWSIAAAIGVGVLALLALVVWWRIRSQREDLESMADAAAGGKGAGGRA